MNDDEIMRSIFAKAVAAMTPVGQFDAPYRVVFRLNPSAPGGEAKIDEISHWARSPDRAGRSHRSNDDDAGEVTFDFEKAVDAVECELLFK
jgi:hypothetical protein